MSLAAAAAAPRETGVEDGGYVKGVGIAVVTQNKDPDGYGRVKLRYTWFDQPRESVWARVALPMAGNDRGFAMIPEVGDEVAVCFERGDLRFPIVIGALFGGKAKIPFSNSDGKNDLRVIKSRAGHHLSFNDGARKSLELSLKDGKKVLIDDKGVAGGVGAVAVSAIVFLPAGFFMTGTSAMLPAGTAVKGFIDEDVPLNLVAAAPAPLTVGAPVAAMTVPVSAAPKQ